MTRAYKDMRTKAERVAFDRGGGSRGISHRRDNPFSREAQAELHAAWESGWAKADEEADCDLVDDELDLMLDTLRIVEPEAGDE